MKYYFFFITVLLFSNTFAQTKFKIKVVPTKNWKSVYYIVDEKGKTLSKLDTTKYIVSLNDFGYKYFAVFMIKGESGWSAINSNQKILFKVYNTSFGEPSPDEIIENKIRIVDENNKIGFANHKGTIIIKPQFDAATSFYKGNAIIGVNCDKIPWDKNIEESDCQHYSIVCNKHGYIDTKGTIKELENTTFEAIQKKIKWKAPEND